MMCDYLPTYGNTYWKTPNIDALAEKGTVFRRHYTAAPSTAMAFTSMLTGIYPYRLERRRYEHVDDLKDAVTLFDDLEERGYENHIIWSNNYVDETIPFSNCYGKNNTTIFHNLDLNQVIGPSMIVYTKLERDDELAEKTLRSVLDTVDEIFSTGKKVFLWIHLPHVLLGRIAYGDDIDLMDAVVGHVRKYVSDDEMFITADHGHMNGSHGILGYAFDVYESAIHIPLITPLMENSKEIDFPTSNVNLATMILHRTIPRDTYIFSDCAYFAQPHRKLAIIKGSFKYIYNKATKSEELYDLAHDPQENINLLNYFHTDKNRMLRYAVRDVHFNPHWDEVPQIAEELRTVKDSIWRVGTFKEEGFFKIRKAATVPYHFLEWIFKSFKKKLKSDS